MSERTYSTTLEFKVAVEPDDLTFNINTKYHNAPNHYVKDAMSCLMFKLPNVVQAGWEAFERIDPNVEKGFSHNIHFDFCHSVDDEYDVSCKVDNPNEIGRTLIGVIQRILTQDPVIDKIIQRAK
ncbi:hypothetical protein [Rodentibacter pneumotropicus]|uniref:Uncharacterized protein n=1 Tax=Rodentibacter pneumotropicus TaxID=758 RepID=A0A4S2Q362_9PAST|nr:hypothetical protein [Rodentibacter pneumotropicus]THA10475.1 hypothetical protein D3M78_02950 [Rodentibacter pneumotropicus]